MEKNFDESIVEFINFVQFEQKIPSVELARITGLSINVLWNICNHRTKIDETKREQIFKGLNVSFDEFVDYVTINNLKMTLKGGI